MTWLKWHTYLFFISLIFMAPCAQQSGIGDVDSNPADDTEVSTNVGNPVKATITFQVADNGSINPQSDCPINDGSDENNRRYVMTPDDYRFGIEAIYLVSFEDEFGQPIVYDPGHVKKVTKFIPLYLGPHEDIVATKDVTTFAGELLPIEEEETFFGSALYLILSYHGVRLPNEGVAIGHQELATRVCVTRDEDEMLTSCGQKEARLGDFLIDQGSGAQFINIETLAPGFVEGTDVRAVGYPIFMNAPRSANNLDDITKYLDSSIVLDIDFDKFGSRIIPFRELIEIDPNKDSEYHVQFDLSCTVEFVDGLVHPDQDDAFIGLYDIYHDGVFDKIRPFVEVIFEYN